MLGVVLFFLVVVIDYQLWMYRKFRELMDSRAPEERPAY